MLKRRFIAWILSMMFFIVAFTGCSNSGKEKDLPQVTPAPAVEDDPSKEVGILDTKYKKLIFTANIKKEAEVTYCPVSFDRKVEPYKVKEDLSNITNLERFGKFSEEQKVLLSKNAFVVIPSNKNQLSAIYEENSNLNLPSFITSDSVLQAFYTLYNYMLSTVETDELMKIMEELTASMLDKSIYLYDSIENPVVKTAASKNAAYFAVAQMMLKKTLPSELPSEIRSMAEGEYALVERGEGTAKSVIFPFKIDYSIFRPRAHYAGTDDLRKYYRAMTWYSQTPLPLYKDSGRKERNIDQTLQALLITYSLFLEREGTQDIELWEKIYEPTAFLTGKTDNLTVYDYKTLLVRIYSENVDIEMLDDNNKMDDFYKEADKLLSPKVLEEYADTDTPLGRQFKLMGGNYLPDTEILQGLVEPAERPIPSGLDVLGVLGSDRAYEIQKSSKGNKWEGYSAAFEEMRDKFLRIPDIAWKSDMHNGWLWALDSLIQVPGNGYPSFMTNSAWVDRSLNSALGSWSQLWHDTVSCSVKPWEEPEGPEVPVVLGYVEPSIEVYNKLMWLIRYSRENLGKRGILPEQLENHMTSFEDTLEFLISCSIKELNNEELTDEEYQYIYTYGGRIGGLTGCLASSSGHTQGISESGQNMASIADFHITTPDASSKVGYAQAAVGNAHEIYAVVPIGGKLYLARGGVFSYYEFVNESGNRLTDEEWQEMLKKGENPSQPAWTSSFISGSKENVPKPGDQHNNSDITIKP